MPDDEITKEILFVCLKAEFPSTKYYTNAMMERALGKKDSQEIADRFVALVRANLELMYFPCPELNMRNSWINSGIASVRFIKSKMNEMNIPISLKTLCDNISWLENRYEDLMSKVDYKTFGKCELQIQY